MRTTTRRRVTRICLGVVLGAALIAGAAEIKVLGATGFRSVMSQAVPKFERVSGNRVHVSYGTMGEIMKRLEKGERADVIVLPRQGLDELARQGKIEAGQVMPIARSVVAMAVRKA